MKTTLLTLVAAGLVAAQQMPELPECALECLMTAIPAAGCELTDFACACTNMKSIMADNSQCFTDKCKPEELAEASSAATEWCASLGAGSSTVTNTDAAITTNTTPIMGSITPDPTHSGNHTMTMSTITSKTTSDDEPTNTSGEDDASSTSDDTSPSNVAGKPLAGAGIAILAAMAAL